MAFTRGSAPPGHGRGAPSEKARDGAIIPGGGRAQGMRTTLPRTRPASLRRWTSARSASGCDALMSTVTVPAATSSTSALLLYILRVWYDEQPARGNATGWAAALSDPAVTAALHAVHRAPSRPWTVATLAAEAGLSRAPFARRFAALVGTPPLGYLTWWRMTTAERLLGSSDAPLRSIAAQVGYASEFAFATAFKRAYGVAPGTYRRRSPA